MTALRSPRRSRPAHRGNRRTSARPRSAARAGTRHPGPRAAAGLLAAAAAAALYLATIAPTITIAHASADSGELITAADALGVAHAPGYGLYLLLARGALTAFGWLEEPALRTNLLSALLSAAAAGVVAATARRWAGLGAALLAGVLVAAAPVVWSQAIVTEVYALATLLVACAAAALAALLADPRPAWRWAALGLALGLAAAHHPSGWEAAAAIGGVGWLTASHALRGGHRGAQHGGWRRRGRSLWPGLRRAASLALAAALPLVVAGAYLWVRADATLAWGDTRDVGGWWHHLSGADYRYLWEWSPADAAARAPASLRLLLEQLPPPAWALVPLGLGALWERRPALVAAALLHAAALVALVTVYRATGREPYLAGAVVWAALVAAPGWEVARRWWWELAAAPIPGRAAAAAAAVLVAAWALWWTVDTGRAVTLRGDRSAEAPALAALAAAPPGGTVTSDRDELTFPLWYLVRVRRVRPDVTVVDTRGLAPVVGPVEPLAAEP